MNSSRPPSVDRLARTLAADPSLAGLPFAVLVDAARAAVRAENDHLAAALEEARAMQRRLFTGVINATGVLLHTNLGRAPLAPNRPSQIRYSNLEFDLATGQRGSRAVHTGPLLAQLCGAEAGLVVNNGAAALMLVLAALGGGRRVAVSRGELIEIGGGFRIPDVMAQSGAQLVEVGTTNKTRVADFAAAHADGELALTVKVHTSNYRMVGFVEETSIAEMASVGVPVVADIGSGLLDPATPWLADASGRVPSLPWLAGEPSVKDALAQGADLVVFSCDKLLGGPQGGAIVGSKRLVDVLAKHPLTRAMRPGSLVVSALQETLLAYLRRDVDALPFWRMASTPVEALERRARAAARAVDREWCAPGPCDAVPGGGTLPGVTIPSYGLILKGSWVDELRSQSVPVIARSADGGTVVDLRTVDPADDDLLSSSLGALTKAAGVASADSSPGVESD